MELQAALAAASTHLRASARAIDAINVYPVPDGDTGSNMSATFHAAIEAAEPLPATANVGELLGAIANGALYGARGNSGVILSQALRGFADSAADAETLDARLFANGLTAAARAAYRAVSEPVEGTMLTVFRVTGEAATAFVAALPRKGDGEACLPTLRHALAAAETAQAATIDQLPALREAGVVDAGGEGVCTILRGLVAALTGETPLPPPISDAPAIPPEVHDAHETFGFCTEFLLEPHEGELDVEAVRAWAGRGTNRSVVVVGSPAAVRVHLHADDGPAVLEAAARLGRVSRAKVDDMSAQHVRFRTTGSGATAPLAVLALSRGAGFDRLFESLGAHVADLGEVVKPPVGDIVQAADAIGAADVILLPNHRNVLLAARQAAELTRCKVHVIESATLPHGLAAAFAFEATRPLAENLQAMRDASEAVTAVEVTIAAADRTADGVTVRSGEAIALVDGRLVAAAATPREALLSGLEAANATEAALATVFAGEAVTPDDRETAVAAIGARFPGLEIEAHNGGQPLYHYVASVEH